MSIDSLNKQIDATLEPFVKELFARIEVPNSNDWEFEVGFHPRDAQEDYYLKSKDKKFTIYVMWGYLTAYYGAERIFTEESGEEITGFWFWKKTVQLPSPVKDKFDKIFADLFEERQIKRLESRLAKLNGMTYGGERE